MERGFWMERDQSINSKYIKNIYIKKKIDFNSVLKKKT
jgi:hypothetical protein